jgi:hypothetical protein
MTRLREPLLVLFVAVILWQSNPLGLAQDEHQKGSDATKPAAKSQNNGDRTPQKGAGVKPNPPDKAGALSGDKWHAPPPRKRPPVVGDTYSL